MTTHIAKRLSIAAALGFAGWVVWLWVDPVAEPEKRVIENSKPVAMVQNTQPAQQSAPSVLVLPAPPATEPKPTSKPVFVKKHRVQEQKEITEQAVKSVAKPVVPSVVPVEKQKKEMVHEVTQTEAVGGRALLRVLEHGKGPQIEIAWPQTAAMRDALYQKLQGCFGMESALMDRAGNLFRTEDPRGQRWEINLDRFSGFLRQASGQLPHKEERKLDQISSRHGSLDRPVPVRIFPRRVDASLLGGLQAVIGQGYMSAGLIQAQYDKNGLVTDIRLDGRLINGRVKLSQFKRCSWRV